MLCDHFCLQRTITYSLLVTVSSQHHVSYKNIFEIANCVVLCFPHGMFLVFLFLVVLRVWTFAFSLYYWLLWLNKAHSSPFYQNVTNIISRRNSCTKINNLVIDWPLQTNQPQLSKHWPPLDWLPTKSNLNDSGKVYKLNIEKY